MGPDVAGMIPSKSKKALPSSTSMAFPEYPITLFQWKTALQRIKFLYLKGQLNQCSAQCNKLLSEVKTLVSKGSTLGALTITDALTSSIILCMPPTCISMPRSLSRASRGYRTTSPRPRFTYFSKQGRRTQPQLPHCPKSSAVLTSTRLKTAKYIPMTPLSRLPLPSHVPSPPHIPLPHQRAHTLSPSPNTKPSPCHPPSASANPFCPLLSKPSLPLLPSPHLTHPSTSPLQQQTGCNPALTHAFTPTSTPSPPW